MNEDELYKRLSQEERKTLEPALFRIRLAKEQHSNIVMLNNLELTTTALERLLPVLKTVEGLEVLDLSGNQIQKIPKEITQLTALKELSLNRNKALEIPENFGALENLRVLHLAGNHEMKHVDLLKDLNSLEELYMSNCRLPEVPEGLAALPKLKTVDLSENNDLKIPDQMPGWKHLEKLSLNACNLKEIPKSIFDLSMLKELDLSANPKIKIPEGIGHLKQLEKLVLASCSLEEVPKGIENLVQLGELSLMYNPLQKIPEWISGLISLTDLDLLHNRNLTTLPNAMLYLPSTLNLKIDLPRLDKKTKEMLIPNFEVFASHRSQRFGRKLDPRQYALQQLYPEADCDALWRQMASTDLGRFVVQGREAEVRYDSKRVLEEFLEKIPVYDHLAESVYKPAAEFLLNTVLGDHLLDQGPKSLERQKDVMQQIATSLGDCGTPIKQFLTQVYIGNCVNREATLPKPVQDLLTTMALEQATRQKLRDQLKGPEAAEQVAGLLHGALLKNASEVVQNKVKIKTTASDTCLSVPLSRYVLFGFGSVTHDMAQEFAKICCQTNQEGGLIKEDGKYLLSPHKMTSLFESYLADLGLVSPRERAVGQFEEQFIAMLQEHGDFLAANYSEPECKKMLDTLGQKEEFRLRLQAVPDTEISRVLDTELDSKSIEIKKINDKYRRTEHVLSALAKPSVKLMRSQSSGALDSAKPSDKTKDLDQSSAKKRRSIS